MIAARFAVLVFLLAQAGWPQGVIRLKTRNIVPTGSAPAASGLSAAGVRQHYLILFGSYPGPDVLAELTTRRILVLAYVPENALMVSAVKLNLRGLDVLWTGQMDAEDKISPLVTSQPSGSYLVIFQPDTNIATDSDLVQNLGFSVIQNSNLLAGQLLLSGAFDALSALAGLDEVAYILPASAELQNGDALVACGGAVTPVGPAPQYVVAANGGWSRDANGQVALGYFLDSVTPAVPESQVRSEIARALAVWTQYANITITPASQASMDRSIDILFARYAHGDAYPFNGPGGVIAHTFYPVPGNPEPLAGDMHLNSDESWSVGGTVDIFSVALHEAGHALGLGHSDDPTAVMYPYYSLHTGLSPDDIAGIQALYGPPVNGGTAAAGTGTSGATGTAGSSGTGGSSGTAGSTGAGTGGSSGTPATGSGTGSASTGTGTNSDAAPPSLTIVSPSSSMVSVSSATLTFSGTASDTGGVASVQWTTSTGSTGTATGTTAWSAAIPLLVGNNTVTVRAYDAAGNSSWRAVTVVRNQ